MTVRIMSGAAALNAPAEKAAPEVREVPQKPDEKTEKPFVYVPPVYADEQTRPRVSARNRRKSGFGNAVFVQLVITAVIGAALIAGARSGNADISEICENIIAVFR